MSGAGATKERAGSERAPTAATLPDVDLPLIHDRELSLFCLHPSAGPAPEHAHKQLEIAVLFEPTVCTVSWQAEGGMRRSETVSGPGVIIVAPRQLHACCWKKSAEVVLVHLESRLQRRLLPNGIAEAVMTPSTLAHDAVLWQLAGGLRGLCLKENARDVAFLPMVAHCVAARAIELVNALPAPALRRLTDVQLRAVQELVRAKLAYEIHADDLAQCVGLSLQYFNALFKNTVGVTPADYIFECRMQKAGELLRTGRYKIGAVARLVGFWAPGYFTGRFRDRFGMSPRALIDQARAVSSVRPSL